ncbi:MAG: tetratricopeptide repeat protein [Calditrichaeota bacterium]|nr:MAG: tetratricopeptide repeat protein [Calditrichota bacterium]
MQGVQELFDTAVQLFQLGNYQQAGVVCEKILNIQPQHIDTLHLLGLVHFQEKRFDKSLHFFFQALNVDDKNAGVYLSLGNALNAIGKVEDAIQCFTVAIKLNPRLVEAHVNLATLFSEKNQIDQAISCLQTALRINPQLFHAHYYLGNCYLKLGKAEQALNHYVHAMQVNPRISDPQFYFQMGNACRKVKKFQEAAEAYQKAIKLHPNFSEAYNNLGSTLRSLGKLEEGVRCYLKALEIAPNDAQYHFNLANAYKEDKKNEQAFYHYHQAVRLNPNFYQAYYNLGKAYADELQLEKGLKYYLKAATINPKMIAAWNNAGYLYQALGKIDKAMECFNKALEIEPNHVEVRWNRSILNLMKGNYREAWDDYELRWQRGTMVPRNFPQPVWDGSVIKDQTLFIYAEQGIGDTIQFVRFIPYVKERVGKVILECLPALKPLLKQLKDVDQVIALGDPIPEFDQQIAIMSLARVMKTTVETIPQNVPYLFPDSGVQEKFQEMVPLPEDKLKIGFVWKGNPKFPSNHLRSCKPENFLTLLELEDVYLYSLQKGEAEKEFEGKFPSDRVFNLSPHLADFRDTAAAISLLDMVITVDTSVAHLAGAMGKPLWLLLAFAADWRWMLNREDNPWYPTARLFRQPVHQDWESVFKRVKKELKKVISHHTPAQVKKIAH